VVEGAETVAVELAVPLAESVRLVLLRDTTNGYENGVR